MKTEEIIAFFSSLTRDEQIKFLAHFLHYLTIVARDTYQVGTENIINQPKLRTVNEIQHQISSHLFALLENSLERYPDDVLMQIIFEQENKEIETEVMWAFSKVAERFLVAV
ncbi:MAG: hypothetical protein M3Q78_12165 [Acidobacteriota bacterium]|jgi:hypothetical protein|nr:hypothetical protein [Acidobacteriota bacterium]